MLWSQVSKLMVSATAILVCACSQSDNPDSSAVDEIEDSAMVVTSEEDAVLCEDVLAKFSDLQPNEQGKIVLTDAQWRKRLSAERYHILRESGTEPAGSGMLTDVFEPGYYCCAGCGQKLYSSEHKFHSGCGWPAFDDEIEVDSIRYMQDTSHGRVRTEIRCARCDGHLGHVFFGEQLTEKNKRHCVNSGAILFVPEKDLQ